MNQGPDTSVSHFNRLLAEFHASVQREPLIPAGRALDHVPRPIDTS
jgi:hypothetical protein